MVKKFTKLLIRFGFVVRGFLYFFTGLYGFLAAIGYSQSTKNTVEIIKILSAIPLGSVLLIAIFIGLFGYGIWGMYRAIKDPFENGDGVNGVVVRLGYLTSGVSYFALSLIPINIFLNVTTVNASNYQHMAFLLLGIPGGIWIAEVAGLIIIFGGVGQIIYSFRGKFKKTLAMKSGDKKNALVVTARYGLFARGTIFTLIGVFFLLAGMAHNASLAKDPSEVLLWSWHQKGGPYLLGIISAGLMALGIYSITTSGKIKLTTNDKV